MSLCVWRYERTPVPGWTEGARIEHHDWWHTVHIHEQAPDGAVIYVLVADPLRRPAPVEEVVVTSGERRPLIG